MVASGTITVKAAFKSSLRTAGPSGQFFYRELGCKPVIWKNRAASFTRRSDPTNTLRGQRRSMLLLLPMHLPLPSAHNRNIIQVPECDHRPIMMTVQVTSTLPERRLSPFFIRVMLFMVSILYSRVQP